MAGIVAAVVAGGSVAVWLLVGDGGGDGGGGDGGDRATTDARPSASPSPGPTSGTGPGPSATGPDPSTPGGPDGSGGPGAPTGTGGPADYTVVDDPYGFSVAVPRGWRPSRDETGDGAFYRPPGDRTALLQVFRVTESSATGSCELLRISSKVLRDDTPAYAEVSLGPTAGSACELVYEYDSAESRGRRQGIERIITLPGGGRWALLAAGPAADSRTTRAHLTAALESFRPR
ncbi:hypothetical protein [Streptomyces sp. NPDC048606]|uniref:hypothetical protein n=1 Tax=Streptomyces sp. NPDC048606 TaxID=3154726 RepID=UPI0034214A8D